jgi:hypothetical protein
MIDGAGVPGSGWICAASTSTTDDVVRITVGDASCSTELTRASVAPPIGSDSGTAIRPASKAPRNAAM